MEFGASPETNEPGPVLLEYAFARITERITEGIESALGGGALESAIEDGHGVVIDCCDVVAVQIDFRDAVLCQNAGVAGGPVLIAVDGSVHLGFDFTHEKRRGLERVAGVVPSTSIQYTILGVVPKSCDTSPTVTSDRFGVESFRFFR